MILVGVGTLIVGSLLWSFKGGGTPMDTSSQRLRVAATIFPLYDIAKQIAGSDVEVKLILPPGSEPHSFDPSPSLIRDLQTTDIVFAIGLGFDQWIVPITEGTDAQLVTAHQGIALMDVSEPITDEGSEEEEHTGPTDPHYWLSIPNAKIMAENVAKTLSLADAEHADAYQTRLTEYVRELDGVDAEIRARLNSLSDKNIVTFHDAWYYFAKEYGLEVVGSFEPTAGREPTPKYLTLLSQVIERASTKTLYTEPLFSDAAIEAFAEDEGLALAAIDDIGGSKTLNSYIALMRSNAQTIHDNQD